MIIRFMRFDTYRIALLLFAATAYLFITDHWLAWVGFGLLVLERNVMILKGVIGRRILHSALLQLTEEMARSQSNIPSIFDRDAKDEMGQ